MLQKNPLSVLLIEEIFKRLQGRFGNKFLSNYVIGSLNDRGLDVGVENAKEVWAIQLSGYKPEEIKRGLDHTYTYTPDCDSFSLACRPPLDYESAYNEAVQQMQRRSENKDVWSNPKIFHAARMIGNDLNNYPYQSIKWRWKTALDKASEMVESGELSDEIPDRKVELPSPGKSTISKEEAKKRMAEVYEILNKKVVNE